MMLDRLRASMINMLVPAEVKQAISDPGQALLGLNNIKTPPTKGDRELLELYSQSPWLRAIVHKIGFSVAEIEWQLFAPTRRRRGDNRPQPFRDKRLERMPMDARQALIKQRIDQDSVQQIDDHPLLDLLMAGNEELLGFSVFKVTQHHLDLVGEAFWVFERNGLGVPVAIWPLPPHWVKEFPSKDRPFWRVIPDNSASVLEIPVTEMIFFRDPNPLQPYRRGTGVGRSLADELEIDEYAAKHNKAFFYNRARPDVIVSGDNISPEDSKRLEEQWLQKHKGFWRAFKPLFFSRKIDVQTISHNFEEMQMVPLRKHERDTFIQVFGAPPEKLGVLTNSNRSTIQAADFFWTKDIIRPRLELMRRHLQRHLVPMFDRRLLLDFDTPVVQDDELELQAMNDAQHAFKINEWRKKANLPSLGKFGEQVLVPMNSFLQPADGSAPTNLPPTKPSGGNSGDDNNTPKPPKKPRRGDTKALEDAVFRRVEAQLPEIMQRARERMGKV